MKKKRIHFVQRAEVPKIRDFFLIIIGWGESGKAVVQVSKAVFRVVLSKYFSGKDDSAPLEKIGPDAYGRYQSPRKGPVLN